MFLQASNGNLETAIRSDEYEELAMGWLNLTRATSAPTTISRRLTTLRGFAKWAGWGEVLGDYIAPTPGPTVPHPIGEGMDGVRRMIECSKNYEQEALVGLGGYVGLRISESLAVSTEDIDVESRQLTVHGKGDKIRVVPISPSGWSSILSAYVMASARGGGSLINYKDRFARQIITNLGRRAGLARSVSTHDLRATFATEALDRCSNIRVVQDLLGHSSVETTQIYTGYRFSQMREAVDF